MSWLKRFLRKHRRHSPADPSKPVIYRRGNSPIEIGRYTYGYEQLKIRQWKEGAALTIGSFCSIADAIQIFLGGNHRTDWTSTFPFGHVFPDVFGAEKATGTPATRGDVKIGHDVWIGSGATIMSGVTIGDGAVIGARAMVVKDVPPYHIALGCPADKIKPRFEQGIIDQLLVLKWWELDETAIREVSGLLCAPPSHERLAELIGKFR